MAVLAWEKRNEPGPRGPGSENIADGGDARTRSAPQPDGERHQGDRPPGRALHERVGVSVDLEPAGEHLDRVQLARTVGRELVEAADQPPLVDEDDRLGRPPPAQDARP